MLSATSGGAGLGVANPPRACYSVNFRLVESRMPHQTAWQYDDKSGCPYLYLAVRL